AFANGTFNGNNVTSNIDEETVLAEQNPALSINKSASPTSYSSVGQVITYTYNVTNSGNVNITGPITVTDNKTETINVPEGNLIPGQSILVNTTYIITQFDIESGSITNSAFANGTFNGNNVTSEPDNETVIAEQNPALSINKSASPTNYSNVGQIITYSYNVTNIGNVNITGPITVTDDKVGTVPITSGNLTPGQSALGTFNYTVNQADLDRGFVTNAAFAKGTFGNNTTTSNTDNETITANQNPALLINKTADPKTYDSVGDLITYTYNVTNTGNVNITGPITVTDDKVGTVPITSGNLTPGQSILVNKTYSITQADIDFGLIKNAAFATGTFGNNTTTSNTDNETVVAEQNPALLINKITDPTTYSAVGDIITYTYNVTNIGNVNITGPILVTDNKTETIQATDGNLTAGQSVLANATYIITQADLDRGLVTNEAYANGTFNGNVVTSNTDDETITANQRPELTIDKSAFPENYSAVGQVITYRYNVTNTGNVIIAGPITVTDNKTGTIILNAGNLVPGQTVTGTANYTITQADLDRGFITNSAFANGTFNGNNITSEPDNETVIAKQNPALSIEKSASPKNYSAVGQVIKYTYNVTNTGNVNITGPITVTDDRVGTVPVTNGNLTPGQSVSGTANYTITQADLDWGSVTNSAFATGTFDNNTTTSNTDNETVVGDQIPELSINKSASPTNYSSVGQVITYAYNVTNTGNVNITAPVRVTDNKTGTIIVTEGNLIPGQSALTNSTYIITQADLDKGFVTNSAFATGIFKNEIVLSNTDNETVTAIQNGSYEIVKIVTDVSGNGPFANVTKAGDVITYQINVTNNGNINPTNVTVTDTLLGNLTNPVESINIDGVLEVGETWTYTGTYTVTQADIESNGEGTGFIKNTATVDCDQLEPKSDSEAVPIDRKPDYIIDKIVIDVAGKGPFGNVTKPKDVITYQINVTNTGNINLTNVTLNDSLITVSGPTESVNVDGILEVGETWTYTGTYTVTVRDIYTNGGGDGFIENTATVDCDQLDPESDSAKVPIKKKTGEEEPSCIIDKTVIDVAGKGSSGTVTVAGDIITYEIAVINDGNINLTNVTVSDTIIENLKGPEESINQNGILEVDEIWTYTGNYTVTQDDIDNNGNVNGIGIEFGNGYIENTATVFCDQTEP
ncbi:MAG: beta strand repeat-containing protein, partial [Methanosarcina sp.]